MHGIGRLREIRRDVVLEAVFADVLEQALEVRHFNDAVAAEYLRGKIYLMAKKEPVSIKELSKRLGLPSQKALQHIVAMRRRGMVTVDRIEGTTPLYAALEMGR